MHDRWPDIIEAAYEASAHPRIHRMARNLAEVSPLFLDAVWVEANGRDSHTWTARAGIFEMVRMMSALGVSRPNGGDFLSMLFYGNQWKNAKEFNGFSSLYATLDPIKAQNAVNVLAGGALGGSSIWLVRWAKNSVYIAYSMGSEAGLGDDAIHAGLCVADWRFAVRIANLTVDGADRVSEHMAHALLKLPRLQSGGHVAFYMNEQVHEWIGKPSEFRSVPIRVIPQLRDDEPRVV